MEKSNFTELHTGFIAPNGDFYPSGYMEHLYIADELFKSINGYVSFGDTERWLIEKGWISIKCMTFLDHGYLFNFEGHLTPEQIRVIKPIVEDNWERIIKSNRIDLREEFER